MLRFLIGNFRVWVFVSGIPYKFGMGHLISPFASKRTADGNRLLKKYKTYKTYKGLKIKRLLVLRLYGMYIDKLQSCFRRKLRFFFLLANLFQALT
jgi:hypothetical protein